jgi:PST family polysaccharide transporter
MTSSVLSKTASSDEAPGWGAGRGWREVGSRAAKGAMMLVVSRLVSRLFDFGALLVLARLLTPQDFGLVAIAMSLMQVVEAVFELPVAQVVVRAHNPEPAMLDTAFTLSLLRGLVLAVVLGALSWPAAVFRQPALVPLICVLSLSPFMRGMMSPGLAYYPRAQLSAGRDDRAVGQARRADQRGDRSDRPAQLLGDRGGNRHRAVRHDDRVLYHRADGSRLSLARWRDSWAFWAGFRRRDHQRDELAIRSPDPQPLCLTRLARRVQHGERSANLPNQVLVVPMWRPLASAFSLIHQWRQSARQSAGDLFDPAGAAAAGLPRPLAAGKTAGSGSAGSQMGSFGGLSGVSCPSDHSCLHRAGHVVIVDGAGPHPPLVDQFCRDGGQAAGRSDPDLGLGALQGDCGAGTGGAACVRVHGSGFWA